MQLFSIYRSPMSPRRLSIFCPLVQLREKFRSDLCETW